MQEIIYTALNECLIWVDRTNPKTKKVEHRAPYNGEELGEMSLVNVPSNASIGTEEDSSEVFWYWYTDEPMTEIDKKHVTRKRFNDNCFRYVALALKANGYKQKDRPKWDFSFDVFKVFEEKRTNDIVKCFENIFEKIN